MRGATRRTAGIAVLALLLCGAGAVSGGGVQAAGPGAYAIRTVGGRYLTAVNGGGVGGANALHTDATQIQAWERFTLVPLGGDRFAIQTVNGRYLTAVNGGGVGGADSIHTDATQIQGWEQFTFVALGGDAYAIQTVNGRYLTAVNGGGVGGPGALHTDATQIQAWERFTLVPLGAAPPPQADCASCAAARSPACAGAIVLLCIASGGPGVDAGACQACIDANCRR